LNQFRKKNAILFKIQLNFIRILNTMSKIGTSRFKDVKLDIIS